MSNSQRTPTLAALPELSRKIIELARSHRRISVAQAAQWTETNRNTIKLHMRNLVEQGRLVKGGAGRGTWYEPLVLTEQSNVVQRTNRSPLITIPLDAITSLSVENAAALVRAVLSAECRYAELSPKALTLSTRVHVPDGGIDAEVETASLKPPTDCLFEQGVTGFQIKSGTSFKPWQEALIKKELVSTSGSLAPEVLRLLNRGGRYILICTGHDMTSQQRNDAKAHIAAVLKPFFRSSIDASVNVIGAGQLSEIVEAHPAIAAAVGKVPIEAALTLKEWKLAAHMSNDLVVTAPQEKLIASIRDFARSNGKHLRILGEPGLGKTRAVLEALRVPEFSCQALYIEQGSKFGQTELFRHLLKTTTSRPLILVIDELSEKELGDIWRHLKNRCGQLKLITLDHGNDESTDIEIEKLHAPLLPPEAIKEILVRQIGNSPGIDRWVTFCEGYPRVALAIGDNLRNNPGDILKPPATVPIWYRYIHGSNAINETSARDIDCVTQYIALFSRFGYESPVNEEAQYICELIRECNPSINWARFQEIIGSLKKRRVLQGETTLFYVPRPLHVYLWRKFWETYGRGFDIKKVLSEMPVSLHTWFMNMFVYAGDSASKPVVEAILSPDGIFADRRLLASQKGGQFLSILAEANPSAVLKMLEHVLASWSDEDLRAFEEGRQYLVWALEKIAVWTPHTCRALLLLSRLAATENSTNSNNATGTLTNLFAIGPEAAATEASPRQRLPALIQFLKSENSAQKLLGLECIKTALATFGRGWRIVGPEYQGMKERAALWAPKTLDEYWQSRDEYFDTLLALTKDWPAHLRPNVCATIIAVCRDMLLSNPNQEKVIAALTVVTFDQNSSASQLNDFFSDWKEYRSNDENKLLSARIAALARNFAKQNLSTRIQRYVIDVDWLEWDEEFRERQGKPKNRSKRLVNALAKRAMSDMRALIVCLPTLFPKKQTPALFDFGQQLAKFDTKLELLELLIPLSAENTDCTCLAGYLAQIRTNDPDKYLSTLKRLLNSPDTAKIGASIALRASYDSHLFLQCLDAHKNRWIESYEFRALLMGRAWQDIAHDEFIRLTAQLRGKADQQSSDVLLSLISQISFDADAPLKPQQILEIVKETVPTETSGNAMHGYYWQQVSEKLLEWIPSAGLELLDSLLERMSQDYSLSYDHHVEPVVTSLLVSDPVSAWPVVCKHLESTLPKWNSAILEWLKGGLGGFGNETPLASIGKIPVHLVLSWIALDPATRAPLIAHCAPRTLDDVDGGELTRELIGRYPTLDGVKNGISSIFGSGGWVGSESSYLRKRREKFRNWLGQGFELEVETWIEQELEYLDERIKRAEIHEERSAFG